MAITKTELIQVLGIFKGMLDTSYSEQFVAKDGAKVLSTNDFTDALKTKLEGITEETISEQEIQALFESGGNSGVTP